MYQVGETFCDYALCPEMIVVPAGEFMMGSPEGEKGRYDDEGPQHQVPIAKPFAVGKYPVTVKQFRHFVQETKYERDDWRHAYYEQQPDDHPVDHVSWYDAKKYVSWLSEKTEQEYRLLSEAEWEYVARAGTTTAYHFGDTISKDQANYDNRLGKNRGTVAVGEYPANAFGLYDVHGNLWEWVEDTWPSDYTGAPVDGSAWLDESGRLRVLRGGSWIDDPRNLRSAIRVGSNASSRSFIVGFRVARTLSS